MIQRYSSHGLAYAVAQYLTHAGKPSRVEFKPDRRQAAKPFIIVPDDGEKEALIEEALNAIDSIRLV